jgi:predicted GNAT family N-acyltransferase|tara:strand:- start:136 stop:576 length:441 start_codon:yes stop_codon:yes gene_type:complete
MTPATLKFQLSDWDDVKNILIPIRKSIFIEEQLVSAELEWDDWDNKAKHIIIIFNNVPIGCARLIFIDKIMRLERMAIIKSKRYRGFGTNLLFEIIRIAKNEKIDRICISAQIQAMFFYQKIGFISEGGIYNDAGIKHIKMTLFTR